MWHAWFKRLGTDCTIVLSGHKVRDSPHALSYRKEQVIYYCSIQYNIVSVYVYVYIYMYILAAHIRTRCWIYGLALDRNASPF